MTSVPTKASTNVFHLDVNHPRVRVKSGCDRFLEGFTILYNEYIRTDFVPDESGGFECAIEEYSSSWQPHAVDEGFDECARSVEAEYQIWEDQQADLPVSLTETRRVAAYVNWSCVVAPEGRLRRPTMYMSKNWMDNVWSWD
jgi:putative isomerase